jgi:hypothetical protein
MNILLVPAFSFQSERVLSPSRISLYRVYYAKGIFLKISSSCLESMFFMKSFFAA